MAFGMPGTRKRSSLRRIGFEAQARYHRERYQRYRARAYGPRLSSAGRLRELKRRSELADSRLGPDKAERSPLSSDEFSGIGKRRR